MIYLEQFGVSLSWILLLISLLIMVIGLKNGQGKGRDTASLALAIMSCVLGLFFAFRTAVNIWNISVEARRQLQQQNTPIR